MILQDGMGLGSAIWTTTPLFFFVSCGLSFSSLLTKSNTTNMNLDVLGCFVEMMPPCLCLAVGSTTLISIWVDPPNQLVVKWPDNDCLPGDSIRDLSGIVKWPFRLLSDLQLEDKKVTLIESPKKNWVSSLKTPSQQPIAIPQNQSVHVYHLLPELS